MFCWLSARQTYDDFSWRVIRLISKAEKWWKEQSDSQKLVIAIAFINALVFIGWKVPSMRSYMNKYFTCSAVKSKKQHSDSRLIVVGK